MKNFENDEIWKLSQRLVKEGLEIDIFIDATPSEANFSRKEFKLSRHGSTSSRIDYLKERYIEHYAGAKAKTAALEIYRKKEAVTTLGKFTGS